MTMDFRVMILSLCGVVVVVLWDRSVAMGAGVGRDRKTQLRQCDLPTIRNGMTRLRQRGKLVKFQCYKGYTLVGSLYAGCVGGKWDTPIPICAKPGCPPLTPPENGFVMTERQGIMATFFCREHYKPAGVQTAYCDGVTWDRPIGSCRSALNSSPRWCDFEVDDLCGWTHDVTHDFEWKRVVGVNNLKKFRTGPQHDHTTGVSNAGHYMLLESVNQLPEDRARLISPVYSRTLSRNTCVRFYYHMYGATVGVLRVYIKPASVDMDTLLQDQSHLYFEVAGNQKNLWHKAVFRLRELNDDFQIVLDGSAGNTHLSDIAVDDIALLDEYNCPLERDDEAMSTTEIDEVPIIFDIQSCRNRCDEGISATEALAVTIAAGKSMLEAVCDCHPNCEDLVTCCPDYRSLCVFGPTYFQVEDDRNLTTAETTNKEADDSPTTTEQFLITRTFSVAKGLESTPSTSRTSTVRLETPAVLELTEIDKETALSTMPTWFETVSSSVSTEYSSGSSEDHNDEDEVQLTSHEWLVDTSLSRMGVVPTWLIVLLSTLLAIVIIALATLSVVYYQRRYGPQNYKKNAENSTRSANEEFSDVRYLTSDEQLDFTLQTPSTAASSRRS